MKYQKVSAFSMWPAASGSFTPVALLREGVECLFVGDVETGKMVLRDYSNATVGFMKLAEVTQRSPKSILRMFGPDGDPHARNLLEVVAFLQRAEGVHLQVRSVRPSLECFLRCYYRI
jgi:hypothetical protein